MPLLNRCICLDLSLSESVSEGDWRKQQILSFGFGGVGALLIDVVIFNLLYLSGVNSSISSFTSLTVALAFNFVVNLFVFSGQPLRRKSVGSFARFAFVAFASVTYVHLGFEAFIFLAPDTEEIWLTFVRVCLFGSSTIARFFLYKKWVF